MSTDCHTMNDSSKMDEPDKMARLDLLSTQKKRLLIYTWEIFSHEKEALAVRIFQMIFEQSPDAKKMFNFPKTDYELREKKSKEFTFHALRFIQVIESTVQLLDAPSELEPLLINLGRMHARHEENLGFRTHYWGVFMECTLFHFRRSLKHHKDEITDSEVDSAVVLWRLVLSIIIHRMTLGFNANSKTRKDNRKSIEHDHDLLITESSSTGKPDLPDSSSTNGASSSSSASSLRNILHSPRFFRKKEPLADRISGGKK